MNLSLFIMTTVLILTVISPFALYYAQQIAKKKDYSKHRKLQNIIFIVCVIGVLSLEILIRFSGGSGSLASTGKYFGTTFFSLILISHILVAVGSYILWTYLIIVSNRKFKKTLPGKFSKTHKQIGILIFFGLLYTAITAVMVYSMSLNLV
ncbi:DUF420 domain-containing protein [Myroides sp. LJL119]